MMAQSFNTHATERKNFCGIYKSKQWKTTGFGLKWDAVSGEMVPGAQYQVSNGQADLWDTFDKDYEGVNQMTFRFFVFLILVIFACRMVLEFMEVFQWMEVMVARPFWTTENSDGGFDSLGNIPCITRLLFTVVLLVQLGMAVLLLMLGTVFLWDTNKYMELVLNAVALAFVVEIDDALYAGFEFKEFKTYKAKLRVKSRNRWTLPRCVWIVIYGFVLTLVFAGMAIGTVYYRGHILDESTAVDCLCQMNGPKCLSARLWQNPSFGTGPIQTPATDQSHCFEPKL